MDIEKIKTPILVSLAVAAVVYGYLRYRRERLNKKRKGKKKVKEPEWIGWMPVIAAVTTFGAILYWQNEREKKTIEPTVNPTIKFPDQVGGRTTRYVGHGSYIGNNIAIPMDKLHIPLSDRFGNKKYAMRNVPIKLPSNEVFIDLAKF